MPKLPSPSDWETKDKQELLNSGVKGWNPLMRLPALLKKNFEWAKPLTFGFFSGSDVDEARSYGWEHVQTSFFDMDDFNKHVAIPFGLIDSGGIIKWRDNYLMMMSEKFREEQMKARHEAYLESTNESLRQGAYAHPDDPRYEEMKAAAEEMSEGESYRVQTGSGQEDKPRRGRPPKVKE